MTVSSELRKAGPFSGNGVTTSFPFEFTVFAADEVMVIHTDLEGVETVLDIDDNYSVTLNSDQEDAPGGSVTYPTSGEPLPDGELLTVTSAMAYLQTLDLTNVGGFYPATINKALDRAAIQIQQLAEQVSRSVKVPISDPRTPERFWRDILVNVDDSAAVAAAAAASALESKDGAEAARVEVRNQYYGPLAADPTKRPDGTDAQLGDRYFNTVESVEKTFNGLVWYVPNVDGQVLGQELHDFVEGVVDTLDLHLLDPSYTGPSSDFFIEQSLEAGFQSGFE